VICGVLFYCRCYLRDRAFTPLIARLGANVLRSG
jgi:hypothetical protein